MRSVHLFIMTCLLAAAVSMAGGADQAQHHPVSVVAEMIDRAEIGDEIKVPAGVYEGNLVIRKSVVLDGSNGAIFDGLGKDTVIEVLAENVTIRNCTIRGSGEDVIGDPAAIRVVAANAIIESNTIEDSLFGIDFREAPNGIIRNNTIAGKDLEPGRRGDGIRLWWSHACLVEGNSIKGSRDMVFWYSEDLRILRNNVSDSRYGLHFMYSHNTLLEGNNLDRNSVGVYLMYSNGITLIDNRMLNNRGASGYGIGLKDCDDITVKGNALLANRVGIYLDNSPSSVGSTGLIESNRIAFNEIGLLATPITHSNVITNNGFVENEQTAATHGRGRLVKNTFALDGIGNYWSNYAGFDLDGDGIGDTAYEPRSLFGAMLAKEPNLRLFIHSPAQQAIEFTARALPELKPEPTLIDPSPLIFAPEINLSFVNAGQSGFRMAIFGATLVSIAAACVAVMGFQRGLPRMNTEGRP